MALKGMFTILLVCILSSTLVTQDQTGQRGQRRKRVGSEGQGPTRPPAENERGLRELTAEEIPPNLNFYTMDPLYNPDAVLGWAEERIEEKLNRGIVAISIADGRVYLGWRLLQGDPKGVAFNVYRSTEGGSPVRLNAQPLTKTTDFVDEQAPPDQANAWFVKRIVDNQEETATERAELPANPPIQQYGSIRMKDDVRASMVGIADLDGDGVYDFVVKDSSGRGKDPGRISPNSGAVKYDGYNGRTGEFMWRIDLGWNVDNGVWWTPMIARDLDGDNKAEVCVRTSEYAATRDQMHPSGQTGFVLAKGSLTSKTSGEGDIRKKLIEARLVDCIVNRGSALFLGN